MNNEIFAYIDSLERKEHICANCEYTVNNEDDKGNYDVCTNPNADSYFEVVKLNATCEYWERS
jgi:hypothetical protein